MGRISDLQSIIFACLLSAGAVRAGGGPYYYTGATWAQQAQCPADHPISCNSISQGNYCCPSGQYCTWADAKVACCPNDCTCSGWSTGPDTYHSQSHWQPHSSWHPHSSWQPAQSSWAPHSSWHPRPAPYCHECQGQHTTTVIISPQSQTPSRPPSYAGYCSTIYAVGPGLPTSRQGTCGLILVESPPPNAAGRTFETGIGVGMVLWLVGLQALGGVALFWR